MKHPTKVDGFDSVDELIKAIGGLRYDVAEEVLGKLADEYRRQAEADAKRGYLQLSEKLHVLSERLYFAKDKMTEIWELCERHMKDELEEE